MSTWGEESLTETRTSQSLRVGRAPAARLSPPVLSVGFSGGRGSVNSARAAMAFIISRLFGQVLPPSPPSYGREHYLTCRASADSNPEAVIYLAERPVALVSYIRGGSLRPCACSVPFDISVVSILQPQSLAVSYPTRSSYSLSVLPLLVVTLRCSLDRPLLLLLTLSNQSVRTRSQGWRGKATQRSAAPPNRMQVGVVVVGRILGPNQPSHAYDAAIRNSGVIATCPPADAVTSKRPPARTHPHQIGGASPKRRARQGRRHWQPWRRSGPRSSSSSRVSNDLIRPLVPSLLPLLPLLPLLA